MSAMINSQPFIAGRYSVGRRLGSGMQAEVRAGNDESTNTKVALKIIDRTNIKQSTLTALEREVTIMKTISHPNVLALKAFEMNVEFESKPVSLLVLELAPNGELFDFLMHSGYFEEKVARTYLKQLAGALEACHSHCIYHRDIKPENILLDANFQLKLADFGLSNMTDGNSLLQTECGTKSYMAPEILAHSSYEGAEVDVWSLGVVLFIMLCGSPPFDIANRSDWWFNAISMKRYDRFWAAHLRGAGHMRNQPQAMEFVDKILVADASSRLTIQGMKSEAWFRGETLDFGGLADNMRRRKEAVDEAKEAEKLAAMRRRGGQGGGTVDVFARDVNRSIGGVEGEVICPPRFDAAAGGGKPSTASELFLSDSPAEALSRLRQFLEEVDASAGLEITTTEQEFSLKGTLQLPGEEVRVGDEEEDVVRRPGARITLQANVYQSADTDGLYLLSVDRLAGEIMSFQKFFKTLKDLFEREEEEPFTEDMDMI